MLCPNCGKDVGQHSGLCQTCAEMRAFFGPAADGSTAAGASSRDSFSATWSVQNEPPPRPRGPFELVFFCLVLLMVLAACIVLLFQVLRGRDPSRAFSDLRATLTGRQEGVPLPAPSAPPARTSISGLVRAQPFSPERSVFVRAGNSLEFRQGKGRTPDLTVSITLFTGLPRAGQKIEVTRQTGSDVPHVTFAWRDPQTGAVQTKKFSAPGTYTMSLRFTNVRQDRIAGVVNFAADDREAIKFSGLFEAVYE